MKLMETLMQCMNDIDDFPVGSEAMTPSGRRVIVKKHLAGASKKDCFDRIVCWYVGGDVRDLVTLQPHQLRRIQHPTVVKHSQPVQLGFAFG